MIPPMNKTLIGLLALGMLVAAPAAIAVGGAVGGLVAANADAEAHYGVDYSGAIAAADDTKVKAKSTLESTIDTVADAAAQAQADAEANKESAAKTSVEAKSSILGGIQENFAAFGGWVASLWVKPEIDTPQTTSASNAAHLAKDITTDIGPGYVGADGVLHGDLQQDLASGAGVSYNLPPPPMPKANFATSLKMAFESFLHLG